MHIPHTPFFLGATLLVAIASLQGCSKPEEMTVDEVKLEYASMLTEHKEGVSSGMSVITAGGFDHETKELIDIRIEDGKTIVHADRAQILVDIGESKIAFRLVGVVVASVSDDEETPGKLIERPSMTTPWVDLPYKVVSSYKD